MTFQAEKAMYASETVFMRGGAEAFGRDVAHKVAFPPLGYSFHDVKVSMGGSPISAVAIIIYAKQAR